MVTMQGHGSVGGPTNKITKARSKVVKPILKKLSYSEKGSLDLDRGWDDQQQIDGFGGVGVWEPVGTGRSAKDVSFSFGTAGARGSSGGRSALSGKEGVTTGGSGGSSSGGGNVVRKTFQQHGRSHSGNSVATNGSGGGLRAGSFVHPFQQMPRTSTPPLSYANSLASLENNNSSSPREYSPTITENEDDGEDSLYNSWAGTSLPPHLHLNLNHHHPQTQHHHASFSLSSGHQPTLSTHSSTFSQTALRRPSLASQRTSSLTDITSALTSPPQLRASTTTGRSTPRLAPSKSDLHLNLTLSELESPVGSPSGTPTLVSAATAPAAILASPTQSSSTAPMSPLRTSLEAMGTRLRSRSEVDSAARQEHIRQARRKFEERERVKEAKYEREEVERRNRQATKEAERIEKETREWYKATGVSSGGGIAGGSGSVNGSSVNVANLSESILQVPAACAAKPGRPAVSRKNTATSIATTSASVPTHAMNGRSVVGAGGVFGGKKQKRKGSFGVASAGTAGGSRPDVFAGGYSSNGSSSRKNSGFVASENQANVGDAEKGIAGYARKYDALPDLNDIPRFGAVDDDERNNWRRDRPRRATVAKKKTQTYWQGFVLWLRTKIFRLSKR
ncbi:hypothetical protein CONLIGDRAFT_117512 [Coniochaeta ligniaria NRRL 30616]|uniref:Uncharacterized protein n=1 Tax=Coniochaeta ligniaria NRRL 30616 TaxID=1408157 RepID=A0A1J7I8Z2_9PEZI|nr:hypothetical protein CONLIGDRAFT_117512 [Coniochaeta ligniaria NRRL 30616]